MNGEHEARGTLAEVKDYMLRVRMDERDRERLDELAAHHELAAGAVVRMLIKQAHELLERERQADPKKTKR